MAIIYGQPDTEKRLLKKCPDFIKSFYDIKRALENRQGQLSIKKRDFDRKLPDRIKMEEAEARSDLWLGEPNQCLEVGYPRS